MVENVIQTKSGIRYVKEITFGILLHVVVKMVKIIIDDSVITCDEIMDTEVKSYDKKKKTEHILMKKIQSVKQKISIFYLPFY